jgi:hypothetical protein
VSYMCETLNKRVNTENIKDAMTTALKNVKAAPGACREVRMLHVSDTTQDICKRCIIYTVTLIEIFILIISISLTKLGKLSW